MGEGNRSQGVTVSAVLVLLGSLFWLLMAIFMYVAVEIVPQLSDPIVRRTTHFFYGLPAILSLLGIATAIGLFRLRSWARISLLIFSCLIGFSGALLTALFVWGSLSSPQHNTVISTTLMILIFFLPMMLFGFGWLYFFNRSAVKEQFK